MRTLCLDAASVTGFAFGDATGVKAHGSVRLPKTDRDYGAFLKGLVAFLENAVIRWKPELIVYESPILPGTGNIHTLRKLYSMGPRIEEFATSLHLKCEEANLTDIRRHFIGCVRAPKDIPAKERRAWLKGATITMCRKRGFRPADDNDADALALFSFVMSAKNPTFELLGTELARAA